LIIRIYIFNGQFSNFSQWSFSFFLIWIWSNYIHFFWYYIDIKTQLTGLSNQFEPSIVFDPSEFEGPRFDSMHNVTHNALNQTNISKSIVTWKIKTLYKRTMSSYSRGTLLYIRMHIIDYISGSTQRKPPTCLVT
jgi:hypothetical protein